MNHGSLFSGIGGFDLAAEWMGWNNLFHCEWNPFGQKVLKHYWPEAESFNDITKTDFTQYANRIQILTGGFPCQPYSFAGKRKGKDDERHLWPEMLRAIREIRPRWVVGENVFGLVNWSGGLVFHEVQADLEAQGYEVQPFLLPAASVNAPHRRDRIWFVAYSKGVRWNCEECKHREKINKNGKWFCKCGQKWSEMGCKFKRYGKEYDTSDTDLHGFSKYREGEEIINPGSGWNALSNFNENGSEGIFTDSTNSNAQKHGQKENRIRTTQTQLRRFYRGKNWTNWPSQPPVCGGNDGLPTQLDGITFSKWRNESIKGYGNAVCPQVVFQIFKAIQEYENSLSLP